MKRLLLRAALVLAGAASTQAANADAIPYPTPGTVNPAVYSFTAASSGPIVAYFAGSGASYTNELGLLVNGVDTGFYGLNNLTSAVGASFDFGGVAVVAGDVLVFAMKNLSPIGKTVYSDPSLNGPYDGGVGINHVYSTAYTATSPIFGTIPVGTYVAFEDIPGGGDLNYFDETFVFTNVRSDGSVPEPSTLALAGLGLLLGVAGAAARRRRHETAAG